MDDSITKILQAVQEEFAPQRPRRSESGSSRRHNSTSIGSHEQDSSNRATASPDSAGIASPTFTNSLSASPAAPGFSFDSAMSEQDSFAHADLNSSDIATGNNESLQTSYYSGQDTPKAEQHQGNLFSRNDHNASTSTSNFTSSSSYPAGRYDQTGAPASPSSFAGAPAPPNFSGGLGAMNMRLDTSSFGSSRAQTGSSASGGPTYGSSGSSSSSSSYSANRAKRSSMGSLSDAVAASASQSNTNQTVPSAGAGSASGPSAGKAGSPPPSFIAMPTTSSDSAGRRSTAANTSNSGFGRGALSGFGGGGGDHIMLTPGIDDLPFTFKNKQSRPTGMQRRDSQQEIFA